MEWIFQIGKKKIFFFSFWDFAGHEEYHIAHSFFFTSGCVYFLLFDCSLELENILIENKLLYWLYFIQTQIGKNTTVILVATKLDELEKKFEGERKHLQVKERLLQIDTKIKKTLQENKIELKFHKFSDVNHNEGFRNEMNKLLFDKKESEISTLELFFILDIYRKRKNESDFIFYAINNWEENAEKSGLKNIYEILSHSYDEVEDNISPSIKHKIVYKIIEDLSKGKDEEDPFIDVPLIREKLSLIGKGKYKLSNENDNKNLDNEYGREDAIEAKKNLELVLMDLNKLGIIVYFNDNSINDVIISSPTFFNKVFKVILDYGRKRILQISSDILEKLEETENEKEENEQKQLEEDYESYFVNFETNNDKSIDILKKFSSWSKGKADKEMSMEDIWNDQEERSLSNVDKLSFANMFRIMLIIEERMNNEGKQNVINEILENYNVKDFSQLFLSIDENKLDVYLLSDIMDTGSKRKPFMAEVLVKFDFILLKGKKNFRKKEFLVPLLFPDRKPKQIFLTNPSSEEDGKDSKVVAKKNDIKLKYYLPFKPSAIWKLFFASLRKACVGNEVNYEMLKEVYWMDGLFFYFKNELKESETTILEIQFSPCEVNEDDKEFQELIEINIKTGTNSRNLVNLIDHSIKSFIYKWMSRDVQEQLVIEIPSDEEMLTLRAKCKHCGYTVVIDEKNSKCGSCMNKYLISGQFAVVKDIGEGGFGRIYKAKHLGTAAMVAIKERINEKSEEVYQNWQEEISTLKLIEKRCPTLTTAKLICVLHDTERGIPKKYLVMDFVDGGNFSKVGDVLMEIGKEERKMEILRMMLILLNELKKTA
eukprot:TRINITY_DN3333_c0_g1_i1.p1 TRINITY_DN3333_c0_g1~~TRINITY_DN3333_c0_g1_i1.p1  ORF type:complete len:825 (-),score=271.19 TRINITY_DN3333_c0_g1_i1:1543-4017(-)